MRFRRWIDAWPGSGAAQRGRVEAPLEVRDEAVVGLGVGARPAERRHLPAAQLAGDLLEQFRVGRHVVQVDALERQPGFAPRGVVAFEAVGANDALVTRGQLLVGRLAAGNDAAARAATMATISAFHKHCNDLENRLQA